MSWHYRVLRHLDGGLALHEVYGDDPDRPGSCTVDPISFVADADEGLPGIVGALEMALKDARERPILDYSAFSRQERRS